MAPRTCCFTTTSEKKLANHHQHFYQYFHFCGFFKRIFKIKFAEPSDEIRSIFKEYSVEGTMSVKELRRFMVKYQGEEDNEDTIKKAKIIFERMEGDNVEAFFRRYLLGDDNGPLSEVKHDMDCPMSHYFIYTGHNSYLTGNQLCSKSCTSVIINALKKGVRVIELDLWPSCCTRKDVEVRHGGTMTRPVKLKACLNAIKEHAFDYGNEYPVIITFEDHLTSPLQEKVAKMVSEIFGEMLYVPESQDMEKFPCPESLKKRILISTKPPEDQKDETLQDEAESPFEDNYKNDSDDEQVEEENVKYRNLISIPAGKANGPNHHIKHWFSIHGKARRLSLKEQQLENISKTHATDIVRFTQKHMLRIYPKGTRIDSSNFDPMVGWTHGAQMVAFNMQRHDDFLRIMEGMFRGNGGCGYVKKPDILLKVNEVFNPTAILPTQKYLQVKVYMGEGWRRGFKPTHFDICSPPDFKVKLKIHGVPADKRSGTTKIVRDQWVPEWNENFCFELKVPELALLHIKVNDVDSYKPKPDDFGGQTCLRVSEIRQGIRAVRLCDLKGRTHRSVRLLIGFRLVAKCDDHSTHITTNNKALSYKTHSN